MNPNVRFPVSPSQQFVPSSSNEKLDSELVPLMNNTKWDELRLAMYSLGGLAPRWRTKDAVSGHVSDWDGEWYYHFRRGGHRTIEWVELELSDPEQFGRVVAQLREIHVPGQLVGPGARVYGYVPRGTPAEYI